MGPSGARGGQDQSPVPAPPGRAWPHSGISADRRALRPTQVLVRPEGGVVPPPVLLDSIGAHVGVIRPALHRLSLVELHVAVAERVVGAAPVASRVAAAAVPGLLVVAGRVDPAFRPAADVVRLAAVVV